MRIVYRKLNVRDILAKTMCVSFKAIHGETTCVKSKAIHGKQK